ncbi:hypothetical protein JW948_08070 [bacterium]|nr:hypothetical protein [bacterium]
MKRKLLFIACLIMACTLSAAVVLDVGNNMLVETSSGVYVEVDSLVETGTGYLKGTVTSGAQTGMTEFAGMSLSAGLTGSITRNTGAAYSEGNGEGTNFLRYYELSNTSGSDLTADMKVNYLASGNDERNGLTTGPYFVYRYASSKWLGNGFGVTASPDTADAVTIPTGSSDWLLSEGCQLAAKLFLQAPYITADDTMNLALNTAAYIPTTSPYTLDERPVSSIPARITDWVLVELRLSATSDTVTYRSAFLRSDGRIVGDDGTTTYTTLSAFPGNYFIAIRHRNHTDIMSDEIHALSFGSNTVYDFTTGSDKYYDDSGNKGAKDIDSGIWGVCAGDANSNNAVNATDYFAVKAGIGVTGYNNGDANMNGTINATDYFVIKSNIGTLSPVD